MLELIFLGTGHAAVTECYNTCFLLKDKNGTFLVDSGGGNGILKQLKELDIAIDEIGTIFISHQHLDHLLGFLWILRYYAHYKSETKVKVYSHQKVIKTLKTLIETLFTHAQIELIKENVDLIVVKDGESLKILGRETTFFDIESKKEVQYGFIMKLREGSLLFCGDEPCSKRGEEYLPQTRWLLHEAFCREADTEIFKPYEKSHSTVKEAAERAQRYGVENLVLFHTEDSDLENRKKRYREEGERYFENNLFVPDDLERIVLED